LLLTKPIFMKKIYAFLLSLVSVNCFAQLSITSVGSPEVIDFQNSISGVNNGSFTGSGLDSNPGVGLLDADAWEITGMSDGNHNFGATSTSGDYAKGTSIGGVFSGGLYGFINGTDTAMGVQPTGSDFTPGTITLKIQNNTGIALDSVSLAYDLWVNNDGDRGNFFNPSFSTDNITFTDLSSLNDTSVELSQGSALWAINTKSITFTVSIPASGDLFIRWSSGDQLGSGNRDEFALDNISITAYGTPAPSNYTLQILHASDLEGGVTAIERAKYFAAVVDTLEETYPNSITLSAGDNYIPGPFFNAAGDLNTFRNGGIFNNVYNRHFGISSYDGLREAPGRADISIMNIIGFDASALGNHEFDAGTDAIEQIIEEDFRSPNGPAADRWVGAQFPYLSANLDFSNSGDLSNLYASNILENTAFLSGPAESTAGNGSISKIAAATFISEGGEKIGIVGATTPRLESISSPEEVTVQGPTTDDMPLLAAEIQPWIDSLTTNHGINKIVLVTHLQQVQLEEQLATLLHGVDVIIAGGSDAILANNNHRLAPGDVAIKPYPILKQNADGDSVAIVSTNGEYSYVGRLVVEFDANGKLIPASIDSLISGPYVADSAMVANTWGATSNAFADPNGKAALVDSIVSAVSGVVTSKDGNIFGQTDVYLNGERVFVRTEETNFGNLSADANLWLAKQYDANVAVSIKNGGGIRAAIGEVVEVSPGVFEALPPQGNPTSGKQEGEVSQLDIENALRFNNGLSVLDLSATDLKTILEHGVGAWAQGQTPGQFCQVGGVRFSFDPTLAAGSRIQSAIIVDANNTVIDTLVKGGLVYGNGSRTIKVVTLDFLAGGGDGYSFNTLGSNIVDLDTVSSLPVGSSIFAPAGSEQDALAEYMLAQYSANAFDGADTPIEEDTRIENLMFRSDDIFGVSVSFDDTKLNVSESAGSVNLLVNYENASASDQEIAFRVLSISTAGSADYTLSLTDTARANTNGTFNLNLSVIDDSDLENDELLFVEIITDSNSYFVDENANRFMVVFIKDNDNAGPTATEAIKLNHLTSYTGLVSAGSMEILDYDTLSQRLFVTNASDSRFEILDFSNPSSIVKIDSIDISSFGSINSLSVHNGVVACAIEAPTTMGAGTIAFFDTNGVAISNVTVGVLPDMVTFSHDGNLVVVANEGEPSDDYTQDPEGSISIIDVSGGFASLTNANVTTLNFNAFNSQAASLRAAGVRLFGPNASVSQDMEPEYVAISADNTKAYISAQENNALVVVDLVSKTILSIEPLGWKDHSLAGNGLDSDRRSDEVFIATAPFRGLYLPDGITTYEVNGNTYVVSANEGDSRDYGGYSEEERLDDLTLDPTIFPNAEELFAAYGDIKVTSADGDIDNDGDYDAIYTYGGRSFSIWDGTNGSLVYDSGDDLEQTISNHPEYFKLFNVNDDNNTIKNRSDDKGPEPEAVVVGELNSKFYAFVGMERTGGVVVYDVTDPTAPIYVDINIPRDTMNGDGDQAPEGLIFIDEAHSPTSKALLVAANEASNTITIWEVNNSVTSINEISAADASSLLVYPNPASDRIFVTTENEHIKNIQLFDMNGRLLRSILAPKQVQEINVAELPSNVYLLKVETNKGVRTSRIVLQ
jgi:2',3'-cyclic-nucleotide 2'-phosphodiesterase (5'-nucleotidase family)